MGSKGDQESTEGSQFHDEILPRLQVLGNVISKRMFGGFGIFFEGKMFGIISPSAVLFFKVDDSNREIYEKAKAEKHGRMPYFQVPDEVLASDDTLEEWAQLSISIVRE